MTEQILVVEADVALGAVVTEVLRHNGHKATLVRTLRGKVGRIDSVGAVILDIDTIAADTELEWLSLLRPCRESLPIVLMGVQVPEDLAQCLRSHALSLQSRNVEWVQKPFRNEELLTAVRHAQEGCVSGQARGQ